MKKHTVLTVLCLLFLAGCWDDSPYPETKVEKKIENQCADNTASNDCDVAWRMKFKQLNFPDNFDILLNDKLRYDHCTRNDLRFAVTGDGFEKTITVWNFIRLENGTTFKLEIRKIPNCNDRKRELFYGKADQTGTIQKVAGVDYFVLETGN